MMLEAVAPSTILRMRNVPGSGDGLAAGLWNCPGRSLLSTSRCRRPRLPPRPVAKPREGGRLREAEPGGGVIMKNLLD
jgi:hypothetical protein